MSAMVSGLEAQAAELQGVVRARGGEGLTCASWSLCRSHV